MGGANCTSKARHGGQSGLGRLTPRLFSSVEVWKFGFYTLFPLATLYYFSDDDWYNKHVVPVSYTPRISTTLVGVLRQIGNDHLIQYGKKIWPEYEKTNVRGHRCVHSESED